MPTLGQLDVHCAPESRQRAQRFRGWRDTTSVLIADPEHSCARISPEVCGRVNPIAVIVIERQLSVSSEGRGVRFGRPGWVRQWSARRSKRWRAPWRVMPSWAPITPQERPARWAAKAAASMRPSASRRAAAAARSSASVAVSMTEYLSSGAVVEGSNEGGGLGVGEISWVLLGLHGWSSRFGLIIFRYLGRAAMAWMT